MRRMLSVVARGALFVLLTAAVAEAALDLAALFVRDRALPWQAGATRRILCIGDSHTYGAGVRAADAYPAQLQRELDAVAPGVYSVANFGIPGMSTTQLLHRLGEQLEQLRPDLVVVWCGANDAWNRAEEEQAHSTGPQRTVAGLEQLRLYRLVSIALHRQRVERDIAGQEFGDRLHFAQERSQGPVDLTVDWGGAVERLEYRFGLRSAAESARVTRANDRAIVDLAQEHGVRVMFITYPLEISPYVREMNRAIRDVAAQHGSPLVEGVQAYTRLPPERRTLVFASHPGPAIYHEIALDLAALVTADARERQPARASMTVAREGHPASE